MNNIAIPSPSENRTEQDLPSVSIVIPCHNEVQFIGKCLDSIISSDYPKDQLEILVVDGMSDDGTKGIIENYCGRHSFIKLITNFRKSIPVALNLGIKASKGELIVRHDAHSSYPQNYVSLCVKYLREYNADRVGGRIITVPRANTLIGHAIASTLSSKFGVGNSQFRTNPGTEPKPSWVDTVPFWCCNRKLFEKVGLYNEELAESEDMEFSIRLKNHGYKTLLVPQITSNYYARSTIGSFWQRTFRNGIWAILPFNYTKNISVSLRHLVPFFFVSSLLVFGTFSFFNSLALYVFLAIIFFYVSTNLGFSVYLSLKERKLKYLPIFPLIFSILHFGYGLGSIAAFNMVLISKTFRFLSPKPRKQAARLSSTLKPLTEAVVRPRPPEESPLVSIIMSTYIGNTADQLHCSMKSIVNQDYGNLEIVLVYDGPVLPEVDEFIRKSMDEIKIPIRLLNLERNIGAGPALNRAIEMAQGEYLAVMDADDYSFPDRISNQVNFMEGHPEVDIVGCHVEEIFDDGLHNIPQMPLTHEECVNEFLWRNPINHPTAFFRRTFFKKAGLYQAEAVHDWDSALWLAGMRSGCVFANLKDVKNIMFLDSNFFKRRKNVHAIISVFKTRVKIVRQLQYGVRGYLFALLRSFTMLLPEPILRKAYRSRNLIWFNLSDQK